MRRIAAWLVAVAAAATEVSVAQAKLIAVDLPEATTSVPYIAPVVEATIAAGGVLKGLTADGRAVIAVPTGADLEGIEVRMQSLATGEALTVAPVEAPAVAQTIDEMLVKTATPVDMAALPGITSADPCAGGDGRLQALRAAKGFDTASLEALKRTLGLEGLEPNFRLALVDPPELDPRAGQQWGLDRIRAPVAWERVQESDVPIAIIDSGIMLHPEILGSLERGHNVIEPGQGPVSGQPHGTYVAAIIAAAWDGNGLNGVMRKAHLMPVRAFASDPERDDLVCDPPDIPCARVCDMLAAIAWADANGARIINASWGQPNADSKYLHDAIEAVKDRILFVAASGNAQVDLDKPGGRFYPAAWGETLPNVLSVMVVNRDGVGEGGFGEKTVHLAAPGTGVWTTQGNATYKFVSGSSFAVPFVTAAAALAWARPEFAHYTPEQVRELLIQRAHRSPCFAHSCRAGGVLDIGFLGEKCCN